MKPLQTLLGLLLILCLCLSGRADDAPAKQDLKKYQEFALRVQKLVRANDAKALKACFDMDALLERAIGDVQVPKLFRQQFGQGFKKGNQGDTLPDQICKAVQKDGSYTLLRVRLVEGKPRALFRLLTDGGLNYHDLILETGAAGEPRIVDLYVALGGELLSQQIRRIFLLAVAADPKIKDKIDLKNDFIANLAGIKRFLAATHAGRYREALKEWAKLPASIRREKSMFLLHVTNTAGLMDEDPKGYEKAMDDFRAAFPNDAALDLLTLDNFFLKKKFADFHRGIDHLEKSFGPDPYLDVLRASGYLEEGKTDQAKKAAHRAIKNEPNMETGYWTLLSIYLHSREHKETVRLLVDIEKRFKFEFDDLTGHEEYKEFVKSPEYKEWMKQRKKF